MLTADLARSRTSDGEVTPLFIDPDDTRYRKTASELIELFETHVGEPKADLDAAIDQLTVADTDYKIIQGLAKLLRDECDFETVAAAEPREIRQRLFEQANDSYPIVRQPTLSDDTQKLDVYTAVADDLGISLAECHQGIYADLDANSRLVRFGDRVAESVELDTDGTTSTTQLTGQSEEEYTGKTLTVGWLLHRYNLALAQAVLYDAIELRIRVWNEFATVFSYVKLFGLMHRIHPIDERGERVSSTDRADGYEAILDGPASLFRQSRKYGIRMANFLPALPHCERWDLAAEILTDDSVNETRELTLDQTAGLQTHYSGGSQFDSDLERTLATKWERANTEWELVREDDVIDLGAEVLLPDFALEHPDGHRGILEIVGFWTPEYLDEKLAKIRQADVSNLLLAVSKELDCTSEDIDLEAERLLWFKTGIHVYDVVDLAEEYVVQAPLLVPEEEQSLRTWRMPEMICPFIMTTTVEMDRVVHYHHPEAANFSLKYSSASPADLLSRRDELDGATTLPNANHRTGITMLQFCIESVDSDFAMPCTHLDDEPWQEWVDPYIVDSERLITIRRNNVRFQHLAELGVDLVERKDGIQIRLAEFDLDMH